MTSAMKLVGIALLLWTGRIGWLAWEVSHTSDKICQSLSPGVSALSQDFPHFLPVSAGMFDGHHRLVPLTAVTAMYSREREYCSAGHHTTS